jgi:UDP-N-acetylglucosamine--N-acetylmuramyl-(pentapeptide) pyrophosphoryl-undecaprenol N-acetylglucosamine transferase
MTANRPATFVFAGGGTGGHLYPAIAIADRLSELLRDRGGSEIHFVGTRRGIEFRVRESLGYPLHLINIRGLVRSFTPANLLVPFAVLSSLVRSWLLLHRLRPDVVVGTGGYVAWPVLRTAAFKNIPTVLQEQNSFAGVTTRRLAPYASHVFLGFAGAKNMITPKAPITVTGNPVRASVLAGNREDALRHFGLDPNRKTILIIGGSQGARAINTAVLASLERKSLPESCQLLWQTGTPDHDSIVARLRRDQSSHALFAFSTRMDLVYAAADIAVARAGALTLAELEACGIPALLIPYPQAAGDHQRKNAAEYAAPGRARVIDQNDLAAADILAIASNLLDSGEATHMKDMIVTNRAAQPAVDRIAAEILRLLESQGTPGGSSDN